MSGGLIEGARRIFYERGGPWYRCRLAERFGSTRYSHPALFDMDRRLARLMPWQGGVFVEAGAHDGYTQSNTYFLERHCGWSGVLVEAVPALAKTCALRRPRSRVFGCALVGEHTADATVEIHYGDLMSALDPASVPALPGGGYSARVPARTLSSVLDEAGLERIDLLVLDVEGREQDVLRGLDLDRHAPAYMLVEALELELMRPAFVKLLSPRYELLEEPSAYDLLFRRVDAPS